MERVQIASYTEPSRGGVHLVNDKRATQSPTARRYAFIPSTFLVFVLILIANVGAGSCGRWIKKSLETTEQYHARVLSVDAQDPHPLSTVPLSLSFDSSTQEEVEWPRPQTATGAAVQHDDDRTNGEWFKPVDLVSGSSTSL